VVLRGKTVVQQYGVKTLIGNRNALKYIQMLSVIAAQNRNSPAQVVQIIINLLLLLLLKSCRK